MPVQRLVIVGASLAGLRAATAARRAGHEGGIVVVGAEPHLPYTRPPLSKELLQGKQTETDLALPIGELDVDWRLGVPATGLDRSGRSIMLADGDQIAYERLIIATGSRARLWDGPGATLRGVHTLRNLDDASRLRSELEPGRRLVIVGAGFIGCEVAASARALDLDVTLVDIAKHPLTPFGPQLGERWARLHSDHGVKQRLGTGIAAIEGHDGIARAVTLDDGAELPADVVLIALGSQLNTEWLADSGLELRPGVICDATLTSTVDPDILAAGDIATVPLGLAGGAPTRVEHWTTASEHGQLAGRNALLDPAERAEHLSPPYVWSDQYDLKIQALGCPGLGVGTELLESTPDGDRFVAAAVNTEGELVGVVAVNAARRLGWYRKQLSGGTPRPLTEITAELKTDESRLGDPVAGQLL